MLKQFGGAVIYTDGSARPNPGFTGWGAHGYFYKPEETSKKVVVAKHHLVTQYGYIHQNEEGQNPRALSVEPMMYLDAFGSGDSNSTNNAAEVDAFYFVIQYLLENAAVKEIQIFTDSDYLRKGITEWRKIWETSRFTKQDGTEVRNKERWIRVFAQIDELKEQGINLQVDWIKGHADKLGNELADRQALLGMLYSAHQEERLQFDLNPAKGYWKSEVVRHPFLDFSRLYFNSHKPYNTPGHYYFANPGKNELLIGKRIPDTSYCVVTFNQKGDPVIEAIREKQFQVSNDINMIMMMRLDRVFSPEVYPVLEKHPDKVLSSSGRNNTGLNFIDQKPITVELNPAGLSIRAVEALVFLENFLERYKFRRDHPELTSEQDTLTILDITSYFFEPQTDEKKLKKGQLLKLKETINSQLEKIEIPVQVLKPDHEPIWKNIPLLLGLDVLRRNGLKKIEDQSPKISLLTWYESITSVRYACVIETNEACGIWSNFYADRLFI